MGDVEGLLYPAGSHRVLLDFNPPFTLIFLNLERNRYGTRKEIKLLIESLVIN